MKKITLLVLIAFTLINVNAVAQTKTEIKATLVYNIAQSLYFKHQASHEITIGVFHSDPYFEAIQAAEGRDTISTRIKVVKVDDKNLGQCDLLFLPVGHEDLYEHVRYFAQTKGIFLVTEKPHLVYRGADISLYTGTDNKTHYKFNDKIREDHNFVVHRKLLAYGDSVRKNF